MNQPTPQPQSKGSTLVLVLVLILAVAAGIGIAALVGSVAKHKAEGEITFAKVVEVDETIDDPKVWAQNFPRQYDSYKRTVDTERTRHGGSEDFQRVEEDPMWVTLFKGYAFSVDYREDRGHAYMLSDQRETERVKIVNQPGACLHCHASNIPAYRKVGKEQGAPGELTDPLDSPTGREQLMKGFEVVCAVDYDEATELVEHPVSCIDCHDPTNQQLRVTRPGFINGIQRLAESDDPVPHFPSIERWRKGSRKTPYEPNDLASRQEMRSMVCGQCHVEYHFAPGSKLLTYPWHNGLKMEHAEEYYETAGKDGKPFVDWPHKIADGAPMLKAQHPEFELWSQGTHAQAGVSCSDCHMPYMREGAIKISNHHVRSPMLNMAQACMVCHAGDEDVLRQRVDKLQDRTRNLMIRGQVATVDLINDIAAAKKAGASAEQLADPKQMLRKAQWRLDYVAAENSMGFHADAEAARILGEAMDYARQGQLKLAEAGFVNENRPKPDMPYVPEDMETENAMP